MGKHDQRNWRIIGAVALALTTLVANGCAVGADDAAGPNDGTADRGDSTSGANTGGSGNSGGADSGGPGGLGGSSEQGGAGAGIGGAGGSAMGGTGGLGGDAVGSGGSTSCTLEGTYVNNANPFPLFTVNDVDPGWTTVNMDWTGPFTWQLQSGSCPGWMTTNAGQNMTCQLQAGMSATWTITATCGTRTVTFH